MDFSKRFYTVLENYEKQHGQNKLAQHTGLNQAALSKILSKKTRDPGLASISAIINTLGEALFFPTIQRISPNSPVEAVIGEDLTNIPVYNLAGAGNHSDFKEIEPISYLPVLTQYVYKDICAVQVIGDSMEPLIKKGAYVGVIPFDGQFHEGGIYLVENRYLGLIVKRIKLDHQGHLILVSENTKYDPQILDFSEDNDNNIQGEVVWVWQMV